MSEKALSPSIGAETNALNTTSPENPWSLTAMSCSATHMTIAFAAISDS